MKTGIHPARSHCCWWKGYTLHVHTAGGGKEYTLLIYTAGGGKRYTLDIHTAGGGKECTLHVHTASGGKGYTMHVHTDGCGKECTLHFHTAGGGKGYTLHVHTALKGQCHEIFCFWFFSWISFPQAPYFTIRAVSIFFENSRRYSQLKVHHWFCWQRWQMEKIFNQKSFHYFFLTPLGSKVSIHKPS